MNDKNPAAEYPFTQAVLWQRCLDLQPSLDRDAAVLVARGVTAARIQQFKADAAAFDEMTPDTVLVQEGAVVTEEKDAAQVALETSIQQIMSIVALKDEPRTARYKRFGVADVSSLSEPKLHLAATMLVKQGLKYLSEYQAVGLQETMLQNVQLLDAQFVDGLTDRKESENTRSGATRERRQFANGLYRQLVQLCAAGESYWKTLDATKAREYVVDPVSQAAPVTPVPA